MSPKAAALAEQDRVAATSIRALDLVAPAAETAVRVAGVNHRFGEGETAKQVLFENHLELRRGEIVIMTGPSGSGKTTLLTLIGGLRTVQEGSLQVLDSEMRGLSPADLVAVRRDIGFIFQAHNLFPSLTATQNVRMALELKQRDRRQIDQRARELLSDLGLGHRLHHRPAHLSGGQRQRVAIARALANRPRLILADEPTAALDKEWGRKVVDMLEKYAREERSTILLVTHDNRILDVADRIVNMVDGHIKSDVVVKEAATIIRFLETCDIFRGISLDTLTQVADKFALERHPAGATIIRQGDAGERFYVIRGGTVDVQISDAAGTRTVASLGEGNFFGERALIAGEPRSASVVAKTDVETYTLGKEDFLAVMNASATFHEALRKVLFTRQ